MRKRKLIGQLMLKQPMHTKPSATAGSAARFLLNPLRPACALLLAAQLLGGDWATPAAQAQGTPTFTNPVPSTYVPPGLHRAGPVNPAHGFPDWYQDKTGLVLELGIPRSQAEMDGLWVLTEGTFFPESFPTNFSVEHFWYRARSEFDIPLPADVAAIAGKPTTRARLVLAHEAAFGNEQAIMGEGVSFTRVRIDIRNLPYSGTYVITTPYDVQIFPDAVAGTRLFVTQDVGIAPPPATPETFNIALATKVGPYLLPSLTRGGTELPPVTFEGRTYLADPNRIGKMTGSPLGPTFNVFRIECYDFVRSNGIPVLGANGLPIVTNLLTMESDDFEVTGRVKTDAIPDFVKIDRASYFNSPTDKRVDTFVTAPPTLPQRLPAAPPSVLQVPALTFYPAPPQTNTLADGSFTVTVPNGVNPIAMSRNGSQFFAQSPQFPNGVFPTQITVVDGIGAIYRARVTDSIYVSRANYSPTSRTLTVQAISSDTVNPPQLTLTGMTLGIPGAGTFASGTVNLTGISAPPAEVGVLSANGGYNTMQVTVGVPVPVTDVTTTNLAQNLPPNNPANINLTVAENQAVTVSLLAGNSDPNDTVEASDLAAAVITAVNQNNYGRDFNVTVAGITVPPSASRFPANFLLSSPLTFTAPKKGDYRFTFGLVDKSGLRSAGTAVLTITVQ